MTQKVNHLPFHHLIQTISSFISFIISFSFLGIISNGNYNINYSSNEMRFIFERDDDGDGGDGGGDGKCEMMNIFLSHTNPPCHVMIK